MQASDGGRAPEIGDCGIGVMAKVPRAGYSKTRLCPPLAPDQAASVSAAFLRDTTENLALAAQCAPIARYVAYAPHGAEMALRAYLAEGTRCVLADGNMPVPSGVDGFGRCLLHATEAMLARGHAAACVLSADTPTLPTAILARAAMLLLAGDRRRVVLGACYDGGYYLLGMRAPHAGLFQDIAWSTETVADATRARASALGLELVELPLWYDVDDAATLTRLLRDASGYVAPHTRETMRALALDRLVGAAAA